MKIKLKYFGMVAEASKNESEELNVNDGCSVENLNTILCSKYKELNSLNYKFAVNQKLVEHNFVLEKNDEVALLPPFAGG